MALKPALCTAEVHGTGSAGHAFLPDIRSAHAERYRGLVRLAVVDRPASLKTTFQWKAGADDWLEARSSLNIPIHHNRSEGPEEYLERLRSDLEDVRALLMDTGAVYVFAEQRVSAHVRLLLDKMFGRTNFLNEIIWAHDAGMRPSGRFTRSHDTIFLYRMAPGALFNTGAAGRERGPLRSHMRRVEEGGRVYYVRQAGGRTYRYYEDDIVSIGDVWTDIPGVSARDEERLGWEGQRPLGLMGRIVAASTAPGDVICALPSGAGTLAEAAEALGRRALLTGSAPAERMLARRRLLLAGAAGYEFIYDGGEPGEWPETAAEFASDTVSLTCYNSPSGVKTQPASLLDDGLGSLEYWAAGRLKEGVFRVNAWALRTRQAPTLPRSLPVGDGAGEPCVHLADANGGQWFYSII